MNGEIQEIERKVEALRSEVGAQFAGVRSDLKEVSQALRDLIRLDGDLKRQNDALLRIGKQVDEHEIRLYKLETVRLPALEIAGATGQAVAKTEAKHHNWLLTFIFSAAASLLTALIIFLLTNSK